MCKVNSNEYIIIGGQGRDYQMVKDSIYVYRCGISIFYFLKTCN